MSVYIRIRNGMMPDGEGNGGASEGDIRGNSSDFIENTGVVDLEGGHCLVHESDTPAMEVVVDEGVVYIPNSSFDEFDSDSIKFWEAVVAGVDGERTLAISSNSSGQPRVDLVCVKIDPGAAPDYYASDVAELIIVEGTPGSGQPATPANHRLLGVVAVANGETTITDAEITDARDQIVFKSEFMSTVVKSITSSSTPTPTGYGKRNELYITALATNPTIQEPSGSLANGNVIIIRIKDNGSARDLVFDSIYRAVGCVLPDTTIAGKSLYIGGVYNSADSKVDVIAVQQEF